MKLAECASGVVNELAGDIQLERFALAPVVATVLKQQPVGLFAFPEASDPLVNIKAYGLRDQSFDRGGVQIPDLRFEITLESTRR